MENIENQEREVKPPPGKEFSRIHSISCAHATRERGRGAGYKKDPFWGFGGNVQGKKQSNETLRAEKEEEGV